MKIQKSLKRLYFVASLFLFELTASADFDGAGKLNTAKSTMLTLGKTVMDIASVATGARTIQEQFAALWQHRAGHLPDVVYDLCFIHHVSISLLQRYDIPAELPTISPDFSAYNKRTVTLFPRNPTSNIQHFCFHRNRRKRRQFPPIYFCATRQ